MMMLRCYDVHDAGDSRRALRNRPVDNNNNILATGESARKDLLSAIAQ